MISRGKSADRGDALLYRRTRIVGQMVDLSHSHVLDYGCGNGAQTDTIAPMCETLDAVDIDGVYVRYDGKRLPYDNAVFNAVTSFQVLEHVEDEALSLDEIYRVLRFDGALILTVPNKWWIFDQHGAIHRIPFASWLPHFIHKRIAVARIYTVASITRLLRNHGFFVEKTLYLTAPMDRARPTWLQTFLRATMFKHDTTRIPLLATEIVVYARRTK